MTQTSRPQPEHINTFTTSDSGPYSSDQWANMFRVLYTGDQNAAQGPFIRYLNELEPTEAPANQININTGAGMVNGHFFLQHTAGVAFTPAAPAGNPRIDVVCIVENNTAIVRTAGIATANNLIFPTSLTDYNGTASIEPYTARLAILPGNEAGAPVAPTLDVDSATLYMILLYQYEISVGGVVTANLDRRTFCKFATDEAVVLIEEILPDNSSAIVNFASIPQQFRHLRIVAQIKSNSAVNDENLTLRFNADGGANYDYEEMDENAAVVTVAVVNGQTSIRLGRVIAFSLGAAVAGSLTVDIPNYKGTTFNKQLISNISVPLATTANAWQAWGTWQSTVAINQIQILQTGNHASGTVFSLYGLR